MYLRVLIIIMGLPVLLFAQKKTAKNSQNLETWYYCNSGASLTLLIKNTNKADTVSLNYIVSSPKYIAGDEDLELGLVSRKKLFKGKEIIIKILNAENFADSFLVRIKYDIKSKSILWRILKHDDSKYSLFMIANANLKKISNAK